jgi:predicted DNA binding protein
MPYAKLDITVPNEVWISELSRNNPDTRFRILAATANDTTGFARIEVIGSNAENVSDRMRSSKSVTDFEVLERAPDRRRVQIETTVPVLLTAIQTAGIPLEFPVEIRNGELALELTVPQRKLSKLSETLDQFDISYSVERIQQDTESDTLLTDRQQFLVREAIERGYYDSPRRITLVELAEKVDIAKSTCSEMLHRAEGQVLKRFLNGDCEHQPDISIHAD